MRKSAFKCMREQNSAYLIMAKLKRYKVLVKITGCEY